MNRAPSPSQSNPALAESNINDAAVIEHARELLVLAQVSTNLTIDEASNKTLSNLLKVRNEVAESLQTKLERNKMISYVALIGAVALEAIYYFVSHWEAIASEEAQVAFRHLIYLYIFELIALIASLKLIDHRHKNLTAATSLNKQTLATADLSPVRRLLEQGKAQSGMIRQ